MLERDIFNSAQPTIHFSGIILGTVEDNDGKGPRALICSASRNKKQIEPVLISLHFGKEHNAIFNKIVPGQLVIGSFFYSRQAIGTLISADVESISLWQEYSTTYKIPPHFPSLGQKIVKKALQLCHVNDFLPWHWIDRYPAYPKFTQLINTKLTKQGTSLVNIDFSGVIVRKAPKSEHKSGLLCNQYLCVAATLSNTFEMTLLISLNLITNKPVGQQADNQFHASRGNIFSATSVPVLNVYREDGVSILRCGKPEKIEAVSLVECDSLLPHFYDSILDMLYGRELFWPVFFPSCRVADNLGELLDKITEEMRK